MEREYEFKASNVDAAIEKGLKKLGLSREECDVEVISKEGIFSKAVVRVSPKSEPAAEEKEADDAVAEDESDAAEEEAREKDGENERREYSRERRDRGKRRDDDRRPRERTEYFAAEKAAGKEYIAGMAAFFTDKARVDAKSFEDEICFYIGGEDANMFIGHRGETLDAIQYLAGQFVNKGREESRHIRVTVDADFYRERRKRTLTALAKRLAESAYAEKKELSLEPMNSYERRIIHSALQNSETATTRSEGEGKYRHIVIVPKCEIISYGNVSAEFRRKGPRKTKTYGQKRMKF